jgi:hypothetical protein
MEKQFGAHSLLWFDFPTNKKLNDGCISTTAALKPNRLELGRSRMSEVNRRYFDSLMADRKLSLRGLGKAMDMSHSQLSLVFSGVRKLQLDEAVKLSNIFGEPLHRIVENAGVTVRPVSGKRVPVVGAMRGDGTVEEYGPDVVERTSAPDDLPDNAIAIQCRTAGTPLDWLDGAVFFCRAHNGVDPALLGRLCYVQIKGGPQVVAAVKRGYREGTYNLSGPATRESVILEFATPVLFTRN